VSEVAGEIDAQPRLALAGARERKQPGDCPVADEETLDVLARTGLAVEALAG
jgi:hypothetical protein